MLMVIISDHVNVLMELPPLSSSFLSACKLQNWKERLWNMITKSDKGQQNNEAKLMVKGEL